MSKRVWIGGTVVILLIITVAVWMLNREPDKPAYELTGEESPLLKFVVTQMMDQSGGIYTNLRDDLPLQKDMAVNHHILSESVGLMMIYALAANNEPLFQTQYEFLKQYLISDDYIAWVYDKDESFGDVTVNASIDDLKIAVALYDASEQWNSKSYAQLADRLVNQIQSNVNDHYIFDYYDWKYGYVADHITSSYLDLASLRKLAERDGYWQPVYENSKRLLLSSATGNGLFYKVWRSGNEQWEIPDRYNMIDVLYAALHLAEDGHLEAEHTMNFIVSKWEQDGQIYASYSLEGEPVDSFESPAVYALAYRLLVELKGDANVAEQIYDAGLKFAVVDQESPYYGGFVDLATLEAYSFDQLQGLLAEVKREQHE